MRIVNRIILILIPLVALALIILAFLAFYPIEVIKPNVQPYKVLTKTVKSGDILIYVVDACKYYAIDSLILRSFVDGIAFTAPVVPNTVRKGCGKTNVTIEIPKNLPPDTYHLELRVTYKVNFIHEVEYNFKTEEFTVTK